MQRLQSQEIDYETVLSGFEWEKISHVINVTNGMAWFQTLPVGMKASQPY